MILGMSSADGRMTVGLYVFFFVCLLDGCLTPQQHANVSQGQICTDNYMCCYTEIEVADQTFTSPNHSILTPGRPVPALTLSCQATGRLAIGVPILKSLA